LLVDEHSTDEDMLASPDETTVSVDLPNGKIVGVFDLRDLLREGPWRLAIDLVRQND